MARASFSTSGVIRLQRHCGNKGCVSGGASRPRPDAAPSEAITDKARAQKRRERLACGQKVPTYSTPCKRRGETRPGPQLFSIPTALLKRAWLTASLRGVWVRGPCCVTHRVASVGLHHTGCCTCAPTSHGALGPLLPQATGSPRTARGPHRCSELGTHRPRASAPSTDQRGGPGDTAPHSARFHQESPCARVTQTRHSDLAAHQWPPSS